MTWNTPVVTSRLGPHPPWHPRRRHLKQSSSRQKCPSDGEIHALRTFLSFRSKHKEPDEEECCRLLLPLNVCRKDKMYLPWECDHERHVYEKCVYIPVSYVSLDVDFGLGANMTSKSRKIPKYVHSDSLLFTPPTPSLTQLRPSHEGSLEAKASRRGRRLIEIIEDS